VTSNLGVKPCFFPRSDADTADRRGIKVVHTGYTSAPTVELTWALILNSARHISSEAASMRVGGWQHTLGDDLSGKTLAVQAALLRQRIPSSSIDLPA